VIVGDHDRGGRACADHALLSVAHGEADAEADLLTMVTAVTRDAQGKDSRAGGKVDDLWAVELDDGGRVLDVTGLWRATNAIFWRV